MNSNYCSGSILTPGRLSDSKHATSTPVNFGAASRQHQSLHDSSYLSTSPFIVYRSAKYDGPHARALQILRGYAKYYIVEPVVLIANRCKDPFYQVCGFMLLLITSSLWMLLIIGLFIVRRLRLLLIQRLYPNLIELQDNTTYSFSQESSGILDSVIWTKGKLDANTLQQRFKIHFADHPRLLNILKLQKVSKLGMTLWEACEDFTLEKHIVEVSRKQIGPIVDEPLKDKYRTGSSNKSMLQKFVSHCVSQPLDCTSPPWKIHIVPYISRDDGVREKTCLVIRMHAALIRNREVQRALCELFLTSTAVNFDDKIREDENTLELKRNVVEYRKLQHLLMSKMLYALEGFKEKWVAHQDGFRVWLNLRLKQLEFHSKTVVLSILLIDAKDAIKRCLCSWELVICEVWSKIATCALNALTKLQACTAIPVIILASFMSRLPFQRLGLQRNSNPNRKHISWSDLIYGDLVDEICLKSGTLSPENVVLMACSYALNDYYQQINIQNPRKLGIIVGNSTSVVHRTSALKAVNIPCDVKSNPKSAFQELRILEERIQKYPDWKLLGLDYVFRYSKYFLPSYLAFLIKKRIASCSPLSFTYVNLQCENVLRSHEMLPVCQLYGEWVDDFTFWPLPPLCDFGISITLVQYTGRSRLYVMSPFPSLDTVLTHRCNQYLIRLAEDVNVDRNKIPYSRRSSPSSSSCSTPVIGYVNSADNLGSRSNFTRTQSESLINTIR